MENVLKIGSKEEMHQSESYEHHKKIRYRNIMT
jgi:hypothetical protein